ncbi:MAG: hypothetical protein K2Y35_07015 [Burkholderiales bacterium]|nr:hypothetical protein [Burkholderiales bacterium]
MGSRCTEPITRRDLKRIAGVARRERQDFFRLNPAWALLYGKRLLCVGLAGEAGAHAVNGVTGFERFEVWNFYAVHPDAAFPPHRKAREDYGDSHFGRDPALPDSFKGRAVDVQGRSIEAKPGDDPVAALQRYLRTKSTPTAAELARQNIVLLEPDALLGFEAWPTLIAA